MHIHVYEFRSQEENPPIFPSFNPPEQQRTYLVFESALMILLSTCVLCKNATSRLKKTVIGSFLRVTQYCDRCQNKYVWESRPFIGNVPAGNLFTSAAILFSGSLPSRTLHLFQILNYASIVKKTFFRHQSTFLQPAVRLSIEASAEPAVSKAKGGKLRHWPSRKAVK